MLNLLAARLPATFSLSTVFRFFGTAFVMILAGTIVLGGAALFRIHHYKSAWARLRVGMSEAEVREIMGDPACVRTSENGELLSPTGGRTGLASACLDADRQLIYPPPLIITPDFCMVCLDGDGQVIGLDAK